MAIPILVDPLSILLSGRAYLALIEKLHPNLPLIREVASTMTAEEKRDALAMANAMAAAADAVKKALGPHT
jgi:hypothetical protein